MHNLAGLLLELGGAAEAVPLYRQVLEGRRAKFGEADIRTLSVGMNYGRTLALMDRQEDAIVIFDELESTLRDRTGDRHPLLGQIMNSRGLALQELDRWGEALESFEAAHALILDRLGPKSLETVTLSLNMATALRENDRAAESLSYLDGLQALEGDVLPRRGRTSALVGLEYGRCLAQLERYEEAESRLQRAYGLLGRIAGHEHMALVAARELAAMYERLGREAEARTWRERASGE